MRLYLRKMRKERYSMSSSSSDEYEDAKSSNCSTGLPELVLDSSNPVMDNITSQDVEMARQNTHRILLNHYQDDEDDDENIISATPINIEQTVAGYKFKTHVQTDFEIRSILSDKWLCAEQLDPKRHEMWLISAPVDVNLSSLKSAVDVQLNGKTAAILQKNDGKEHEMELTAESKLNPELDSLTVLVPSTKEASFIPWSKGFSGQIHISEVIKLPNDPKIGIETFAKPKVSYPKELKQRYTPFGLGKKEPVKLRSKEKSLPFSVSPTESIYNSSLKENLILRAKESSSPKKSSVKIKKKKTPPSPQKDEVEAPLSPTLFDEPTHIFNTNEELLTEVEDKDYDSLDDFQMPQQNLKTCPVISTKSRKRKKESKNDKNAVPKKKSKKDDKIEEPSKENELGGGGDDSEVTNLAEKNNLEFDLNQNHGFSDSELNVQTDKQKRVKSKKKKKRKSKEREEDTFEQNIVKGQLTTQDDHVVDNYPDDEFYNSQEEELGEEQIENSAVFEEEDYSVFKTQLVMKKGKKPKISNDEDLTISDANVLETPVDSVVNEVKDGKKKKKKKKKSSKESVMDENLNLKNLSSSNVRKDEDVNYELQLDCSDELQLNSKGDKSRKREKSNVSASEPLTDSAKQNTDSNAQTNLEKNVTNESKPESSIITKDKDKDKKKKKDKDKRKHKKSKKGHETPEQNISADDKMLDSGIGNDVDINISHTINNSAIETHQNQNTTEPVVSSLAVEDHQNEGEMLKKNKKSKKRRRSKNREEKISNIDSTITDTTMESMEISVNKQDPSATKPPQEEVNSRLPTKEKKKNCSKKSKKDIELKSKAETTLSANGNVNSAAIDGKLPMLTNSSKSDDKERRKKRKKETFVGQKQEPNNVTKPGDTLTETIALPVISTDDNSMNKLPTVTDGNKKSKKKSRKESLVKSVYDLSKDKKKKRKRESEHSANFKKEKKKDSKDKDKDKEKNKDKHEMDQVKLPSKSGNTKIDSEKLPEHETGQKRKQLKPKPSDVKPNQNVNVSNQFGINMNELNKYIIKFCPNKDNILEQSTQSSPDISPELLDQAEIKKSKSKSSKSKKDSATSVKSSKPETGQNSKHISAPKSGKKKKKSKSKSDKNDLLKQLEALDRKDLDKLVKKLKKSKK